MGAGGYVANVREFHLSGQALHGAAHASPRKVLSLPQSRREHAENTGAALAAGSAGSAQTGAHQALADIRESIENCVIIGRIFCGGVSVFLAVSVGDDPPVVWFSCWASAQRTCSLTSEEGSFSAASTGANLGTRRRVAQCHGDVSAPAFKADPPDRRPLGL